VFDDRANAPEGFETWPADEGQVFSNLLWLDGDAPPKSTCKQLMTEARRQLRIYDQRCEQAGD